MKPKVSARARERVVEEAAKTIFHRMTMSRKWNPKATDSETMNAWNYAKALFAAGLLSGSGRAIELPKRRKIIYAEDESTWLDRDRAQEWNDCLDEVIHLNRKGEK